MDIALWIAQGALAIVFFLGGAMRAIMPEGQLLENPQMAWIEDTGIRRARIAGTAEIAAALGLVLPGLTGIATFLTPLAAAGLVALMVLAAVTVHHPRGERQLIVTNMILAIVAASVAVGRVVVPL